MESFGDYLTEKVSIVVNETISLGGMKFRLVSNIHSFPPLQYFSNRVRTTFQNEKIAFELWCISLKENFIDEQYLLEYVDRTYRGSSFLNGYYVTDHFGPPIYLVTRGNHFYVFGEQLERVVWPYFVKYLLMLYTVQENLLHLKAAALVIEKTGTLLLGRGGAGKTVFLSQLCQHGAKFITNSHSIINESRVTGVASSLRIRPGPWYSDILKTANKKPALKPGEIIIDPDDVFEMNTKHSVEVKNVCIIGFQQPGFHSIEKISQHDAYNYAEQFSLAINVYRLEEDLLDLYKGDYQEFSQAYNRMKDQLRDLIFQSSCYSIGSDILIKENRDEIFDLLSV